MDNIWQFGHIAEFLYDTTLNLHCVLVENLMLPMFVLYVVV